MKFVDVWELAITSNKPFDYGVHQDNDPIRDFLTDLLPLCDMDNLCVESIGIVWYGMVY